MFEEGNAKKVLLLGLFLLAFVVIPVSSPGEEPPPTASATKSQAQPSSKQDSPSLTLSDLGNWVQRSGNRVGEELSKAASKTASAIKKAVSGGKREDGPKDIP